MCPRQSVLCSEVVPESSPRHPLSSEPAALPEGVSTVSDPNAAADQQLRYREFLDLLPLALNLAGLPASEGTRYYTEDQIELRANTIKHAYKFARQVAKDYIQR